MLGSLSKNVVVYGGTNALRSFVPFIMLPILTVNLTPLELGTLSLIETTVLFLLPLIMLNVNSSVGVEYVKLEKKQLGEYLSNCFAICFISYIILSLIMFMVGDIASVYIGIPFWSVIALSTICAVRVVFNVCLVLLQMSNKPFLYATFSLVQIVLDIVLSLIFLLVLYWGVIGRISAVALAFLVVSMLGMYILVKEGYLSKLSFNYTKDILSYGLPLIPHVISGTVISMSDRYFISFFSGVDKVGVYTVAYQVSALMLLVGVSINQAWTPMLFRLLKLERFNKAFKFSCLLCFPLFCTLFFLVFTKDFIFDVFISQDFFEAKNYYLYLLIGFCFQSLYFLVTNLFFYYKKTKQLALITFFGALLNLILNYYLILKVGVIGVAIATMITWGVFLLLVSFSSVWMFRNEKFN